MIESYNQNGACISYNSTHAIIFGESDHGVTDTLKKIPGETLEGISGVTDALKRLPGETLKSVSGVADTLKRMPGETLDSISTFKKNTF